MNPYPISQALVRISLDAQLQAEFPALTSKLNWKPLTFNLESCEQAPYLYFRITHLNHRREETMAGFKTGAPFMLTRDKDERKRAFFLRHWVRRCSTTEHSNAKHVQLKHMALAHFNNHLLVRVEIDRTFDPKDAFKSVPFATWMFQIVQVDAIIEELPGIRFAFAIERTVTPQERELVENSGQPITEKGAKTKAPSTSNGIGRKPTIPYPSKPIAPISRIGRPLLSNTEIQGPPMRQHLTMHRNAPFTSQPPSRPPPNIFQPNSYPYTATRQPIRPIRQAIPLRPQAMTTVPIKAGSSSLRTPSVTHRPTQVSQMIPENNTKPFTHPYLRLWEGRDPDDPYEPIFVTEDPKFEQQARRSLIIEQSQTYAEGTPHPELFGLPEGDYLSNCTGVGEGYMHCSEADIEVKVYPRKKMKPSIPEEVDQDNEDRITHISDEDRSFNNAIIDAAQYNTQLSQDRSELRRWLDETAGQEEDEEEEEEEDEDNDRDSSD